MKKIYILTIILCVVLSCKSNNSEQYATKRPKIYFPRILKYKFNRLIYPKNPYYLLHTLLDLNSNENNRYTYILVPLTPSYENFIKKNQSVIEPSYIIKSYKELLNSLPTINKKFGE